MNNAESKYWHTAVRMDVALLELLGEKDYAFITVTEICRKAGVNRTTFYLHYETIADLLQETLDYAAANFRKSFQDAGEELALEDPEAFARQFGNFGVRMLISYLKFVQSNQAVVLAAYNNPKLMQMDVWMDFISKHVLIPLLERDRIPEEERIYWENYYRQGTQAIVQTWLKNGCTTSVEEMGRVIMQCIRADRSHRE